MRLDFSGMCRWDAEAHVLVMHRMSMRSTVVAAELALSESAHVQVDSSVLWRGVHGELVHELDISTLAAQQAQMRETLLRSQEDLRQALRLHDAQPESFL